jgi:hypothetical protein
VRSACSTSLAQEEHAGSFCEPILLLSLSLPDLCVSFQSLQMGSSLCTPSSGSARISANCNRLLCDCLKQPRPNRGQSYRYFHKRLRTVNQYPAGRRRCSETGVANSRVAFRNRCGRGRGALSSTWICGFAVPVLSRRGRKPSGQVHAESTFGLGD